MATRANVQALAFSPPNNALLRPPRLPKSPVSPNVITSDELPQSFDSRTNWPNLLGPVLDQGDCGSCYVFAATEVLQDRLSIARKAAFSTLSQQFVLMCYFNPLLSLGCDGGVPEAVLSWMGANSVPFASNLKYTFGENSGGAFPPGIDCFKILQESRVPNVRAGVTYTVANGEDPGDEVTEMKKDILVRGPVVATMNVYEDFQVQWNARAKGIYAYDGVSALDGGHAVKVIGWGPGYWLVQNSWGKSGTIGSDPGYFKIQLRVNEVGIEPQVSGMFPPADLTKLQLKGTNEQLDITQGKFGVSLFKLSMAQFAVPLTLLTFVLGFTFFFLIVSSTFAPRSARAS